MQELFNKRTLCWAFYDWANSAYATVALSVFFPLVFNNYWFAGSGSDNSTTPLGIANSIASLLIVILAPVLGAIADRGGIKKRFLFVFAATGILFVLALTFVGRGEWPLALGVYVMAGLGFSGANIFYDAMIVEVSPRDRLDLVSAFGFGLGYLGGGLALVVAIVLTSFPHTFGFSGTEQAMLAAFIVVALWWAVFSIPLFVGVSESRNHVDASFAQVVTAGFGQLRATFREIHRLKVVWLFLLAYWFYIDGVYTIIRMAMDYGVRLGFDQMSLIKAFLITQFIGFPAAILYGKLGEKIGAKTGILIGIAAYIGVTIFGYSMDDVTQFYTLASVVGLVQGGVQSLSRSLFARIIPANKAAEFFGFYNIMGKFAAFLGPLLMALVSGFTGDPRLAILSIILLFAIGGLLLLCVDEADGERLARSLE
ncbi:MAG: MFS transporter [Gammaproteobacteria bacterium]|nr:MFS transporter [Gammaproteobacteria bacterium]